MCTVVLFVASVVAYLDRAMLTPELPPPRPASVILVLGGAGDRLAVARRLVAEGYARTVAYSTVPVEPPPCPSIGGAEVVCFVPHPLSTQGEGEAFARLARTHGWRSVVVVTGHAQALRGRLRIRRCFSGPISVVPARAPVSDLTRLHMALYEVGATIKAEVWQRSC